ncbi:hypothetical protein V1284_000707 [Nitrobacteraceae bacterium AZCC 2299]
MNQLHSSMIVDMGDGESPMSLWSRTAKLFNRTAREFSLDMGLTFQSVVDGDPATLASLAARCRADHDRLVAASIVKVADRRHRLREQELLRDSLTRASLRVCPQCVVDDTHKRSGPKALRPYGRTLWLLSSVRTCPQHQSALVEVTRAPYMHRLHDFARLIEPSLNADDFARGLQERRFSPLEHYLVDRLNGVADANSWLQKLPFYAASKACEILGAVATRGHRFKARSLNDADWHEAGAVGFDIANTGESGIRSLLSQLQQTFTRTDRDWGPQQLLGRLYTWLANDSEDSAYDPLRNVVRDHIIETMPFGPGDELFGQGVRVRRVHSVRSAYLESGISPKRLRQLLSEAGHIRKEDLALTDDRITFDAAKTEEFIGNLSTAVSLRGVERYINAPRQIVNLLCKAGYLSRFKSTNGRLTHAFAKEDLDTFLSQLAANATEIEPDDGSLFQIQTSAKRASCSSADIVGLIFDRTLTRIRRTPGESGFSSILVDPEEVKRHVRGPELKGLKLRAVEQILRAPLYRGEGSHQQQSLARWSDVEPREPLSSAICT